MKGGMKERQAGGRGGGGGGINGEEEEHVKEETGRKIGDKEKRADIEEEEEQG